MAADDAGDGPTRGGPELIVDLDAVAANTRLFAARTAGELMAVVKADGFGHGAARRGPDGARQRRHLARRHHHRRGARAAGGRARRRRC